MSAENLPIPNAGQPTSGNANSRWYRLTPDRLVLLLVVIEGLLLLSERFQWFAFNRRQGWTVLIAVAVLDGFLLIMLLWFILSVVHGVRYQFSIRSLMIMLLVVAVPFTWLAVRMKNAMAQKGAVARFLGAGGCVGDAGWYNYHLVVRSNTKPPEKNWFGNLVNDEFFGIVSAATAYSDEQLRLVGSMQVQHLDLCHVTDDGLKALEDSPLLRSLSFRDCDVTDAGLAHLEGLHQLVCLKLDNCQLSDAGLVHLSGLAQLEWLDLSNTEITDNGLKALASLNRLEDLDLGNTKLTDDGLKHLEGLANLQQLSIRDTGVTDAGLEHVDGLHRLEYLDLSGTQVTELGESKLKQALPNCTIYR